MPIQRGDRLRALAILVALVAVPLTAWLARTPDDIPAYGEQICVISLAAAVILLFRRGGLFKRIIRLLACFTVAALVFGFLYYMLMTEDYGQPDFNPDLIQWGAFICQASMLTGLFLALFGVDWLAARALRRGLSWPAGRPRSFKHLLKWCGVWAGRIVLLWLIAIPWLFAFLQVHRPKLHYFGRPALPYTELPRTDFLPPGRLFPASQPSDMTVLLCHGIAGNQELRGLTATFHDLGCNVVTFDLPNHGYSPGCRVTFGLEESRKVVRVARWIRTHPFPARSGRARLVGYGMSMGGTTLLLAAEQDPASFDGLIVDSSFASLQGVAEPQISKLHPLVRIPLRTTGELFSALEIGAPLSRVDVTRAIRTLDGIPKLIFHCREDGTVPFSEGRRIFEAAGEPKQFVGFKTGGHMAGMGVDRERYMGEVADLLGQATSTARAD